MYYVFSNILSPMLVHFLHVSANCVHALLQGTQLYDPKAGGWRDLGMLDVMQVNFGTQNCLLISAHNYFISKSFMLITWLPLKLDFWTCWAATV